MKIKNIEELRKEFESLIGDDFKGFEYTEKENKYTTDKELHGFEFLEAMYSVCTINGAWWMFQELKKSSSNRPPKIDGPAITFQGPNHE